MAQARTHRLARGLAVVCSLALAGVLGAGCGGSSPGAGADPAAAVPASTPLYVSAIVRPNGSLRAATLADGQALTHEADPFARLLGALQTPGSPQLDYARDVRPWLGPRAGAFLLSAPSSAAVQRLVAVIRAELTGSGQTAAFPFGAAAGGAQGALVLDAANAAKARAFLAAQAKRTGGAHAASYRNISYEAAAGGLAFGVVGDFAVIGSEAAMRAVIETHAGGPSLARAAPYARLTALAPSGALARLYANGPGLGASAAASHSAAGSNPLAPITGARVVDASIVPARGSVAIDIDSLAGAEGRSPKGLFAPGGEGPRALGELPGEAFIAAGFGQAAPALAQLSEVLGVLAPATGATSSSSPIAGFSLAGLVGALRSPLGVLTEESAAARRDFRSWMGSASIFASGTGLLDLRAGLVISSRNPALSRAAVTKFGLRLRRSGGSVSPVSIAGTDAALSARIPGLPVAVDVADGRDAHGQVKFVIALGEASVSAALAPQSSFSGSGYWSSASAALGEGIQPTLAVQVPTLIALLEGAGLGEDPSLSPVLPFLRALGTVSGGGRSLGADAARYRLVLGLRGG